MTLVAAPSPSEDAFAGQVEAGRTAQLARRRRTGFPWLRLWLGSAAATALVVAAGQSEPGPSEGRERAAVDPAPVSAPPPDWESIARPAALYAIAAPDLQDLPLTYEARRDRSGAREDILTLGSAEGDAAPYLRLAAHQATVDLLQPPFFVDLARRAADAGLAVSRSAPEGGLRTKFDTAEVAEMALSGDVLRPCLAFRFSRPEAAWRVGGWLCGAGPETPSQRQLACFIDGLTLRSADNAALSALFAKAERQRDRSCIPPPRIAAATKPSPPPRNTRRR